MLSINSLLSRYLKDTSILTITSFFFLELCFLYYNPLLFYIVQLIFFKAQPVNCFFLVKAVFQNLTVIMKIAYQVHAVKGNFNHNLQSTFINARRYRLFEFSQACTLFGRDENPFRIISFKLFYF